MVVEPTSIATPKARSAKPGMMATMSRPLRSATVTFHCPARNAFCKASERREIGGAFRRAPLLAQSLLQTPEIARRLVHVRLGDLDVIEADDRIDLDRMRLRALAHDLPVDLAFGRARRRQDRRKSWLGSRAAGRAERPRASRRSGPRPLPMASHDRRSNEWRAWRNRPPRRRPDSGRKCRARHRPNRDRRRARARLPRGLSLRRTRPAFRKA